MAHHTVILFAVFALTCRGTNTTGNWTSINHHSSASSSSTHGAIGDYVAAGLGMSPETSSVITLNTTSVSVAMTVSSDSIQTSNLVPLGQAQLNYTMSLTATASVTEASGHVSITTNVSHTASGTDCWHSWLEYWSASADNQITSTEEAIDGPSTVTMTVSRDAGTSWTTTTWKSFVYTFTQGTFTTLYSDGYPVSVSASYDTFTSSQVGWTVDTLYSSLSEYITTLTDTWNVASIQTITRSATALPAPSCELPSAATECSAQWSSYIQSNTGLFSHPYYAVVGPMNSSSGTWPGAPYCTQAQVTGDLCTSMRSYYLAPYTAWGQGSDVGWETANGTAYFPATKSLAPGCTLGCQACSITGNSVQLYYWPPSTATLVENGTETAMLTPFAQNHSGVRTVSIDGTILTSPTVYISYDTLYAANSCGAIGKNYKNTILPLLDTNHLFSLEPFIPFRGLRSGYITSSFNLADLIEPIADLVYDKQSRCRTSSNIWRVSSADEGGTFSCARTAPYAPIIGVPPEVRGLDPAWEPCGAWYGGLFDPPKALQPADAIAVPTLTSVTTTASPNADPKPTVDSGLPAKTSPPVISEPKPQAEQSEHATNPTPKSETQEATHVSGDGETEASPLGSNNDPSARPDTTRPEASSADELQDPVATQSHANTQLDPSEGVAAILSMLLTKSGQATAPDSAPHVTQASDPDSRDGQGVAISVGSQVHRALASQGRVVIDGTPLAGGQATVIGGQTISAISGTVMINGAPQPDPALQQAPTPLGVLTVAGQEHSVVQDANGNIQIDGESFAVGAVTAIDGSTVTVASEGVLGGATVISYAQPPVQDKQSAIFTANGHTYTVEQHSGSIRINGATASTGEVVTINGEALTIGSDGINVDGTTIAFASGQTAAPPAITGANIVIASKTMSALKDGDDVLVDGTRLTLGQVATLAGTKVRIASDGIVVGTSTASFYETYGSTTGLNDVVTIDGQVYSASKLPGQSGATVLAGQTLSQGGSAATINGEVVTYGPHGISTIHSAASMTVGGGVGTAYPKLPGLPDAVLLAGHTLSRGGPAATIDGEVISYGSHGISVVASAGSATVTPTYDPVDSVITIDGTAYTATPVQGRSGVVVLGGQTLSIGGSGVTIASHFVTEGSNGVSLVDSTAPASDGADFSRPTSTTDTTESYTSAVQQSSTTPDRDSSGSVKVARGFDFLALMVAMMAMMLIKL